MGEVVGLASFLMLIGIVGGAVVAIGGAFLWEGARLLWGVDGAWYALLVVGALALSLLAVVAAGTFEPPVASSVEAPAGAARQFVLPRDGASPGWAPGQRAEHLRLKRENRRRNRELEVLRGF